MEILQYVNNNPIIPFVIFAFIISVILILITKQNEKPPDIELPKALDFKTFIAFLIKISLERPRGISVLTLVMLFLVIAIGSALSSYTNYIAQTEPVAKELIKRVDEMAENQGKLTESLSDLKTEIRASNQHPQLLSKLVNENSELIKILVRLRKETASSRVSVMEFHNGSKTFSGMPFGKVSTTQEVAGYGVTSEIDKYQNLPIREFINIIPKLLKKECITYSKYNQNELEKVLSTMLKTRGTRTAVFCPLFVPFNNEPIGIVLVEWNHNIPISKDMLAVISETTNIEVSEKLAKLVFNINNPNVGN